MARERISQLDILQTQERSLLKHTAVKIDRLVQARYPRLDKAINFDKRILEKATLLHLKYIQLA